MAEVQRLPPLRQVVAAAGLDARKSLGQHFLMDLNLTAKIARAAGDLTGMTVLEVGPGPGGLTRALLATGAQHVVAVERDARAVAALQPLVEAAGGRLTVVEGDALTFDAATLPAPRAVVANLPYNVGTALLVGWLARASLFERLVLMFQREVAERLVAAPGSKTYGRLSVLTQWRTNARLAFTLPPSAFTPPPKVESTVVVLEPRPDAPDAPPLAAMEAVTAAAFGQRRKMLRGALKSLVPEPERLLNLANISADRRAESLSVGEFAALAARFAAMPEHRG